MKFGIVRLYSGVSGTKGFYNCQEIGLAKALVRAGHTVVVFFSCKDIKMVKEECIEKDILLVLVPVRTLGVHSLFPGGYLVKYGVEIVQIAGDNQLFAPNLLTFCRKNSILAYTYNGTVQSDTTNKLKKILFNLLVKRNILAYNKHVCFAKTIDAAEQLKKRGVIEVTIAPVGLDTSLIPDIKSETTELRRCLNLPQQKKILLFVGRLEEYKSPEYAVELLNILSDDYYLVIIGEGSNAEKVDKIVRSYHLEDRVCRIPKIPNKQIHYYYTASEYYVNFNKNEIFGMAILEAMYNGCTVIAHSAPGPNFIIENEKTGYIADDIFKMKEIINTRQPLSRQELRQYILENFTWDNTVRIIQGEIMGEGHG